MHQPHSHSHSHGAEGDADEAASIASMSSTASLTAEQIFHDTAGWKCLETSINCLAEVIVGCGGAFYAQLTTDILDLVYTSMMHVNRYVRETCARICGTVAECCAAAGEDGEARIALLAGNSFFSRRCSFSY